MKLVGFVWTMACLHGCIASWQLYPKTSAEIQAEVTSSRSTFEGYLLEGGEWVPGRPVLVNRDFDMASAMMVPDIGPAIAAGKRIQENQAVVARLSGLPEVSAVEALSAGLSACKTKPGGSQPSTIRFYGVLFGEPEARLLAVLEVETIRVVWVSQVGNLEGENGWLASDGQRIAQDMKQAAPRLAEIACEMGDGKGDTRVSCPVGGNARLEGWQIRKTNDGIWMRAKEMPNTTVVCPDTLHI